MKNAIDHIGKFLEGKGFYITLSLCLVLSLIVGYITFGAQSDKTNASDSGFDVAQADNLPENEENSPALEWQTGDQSAAVNAEAVNEEEEEEGDDAVATADTKVQMILMPVDGTISVKYAMEDFVYSQTMMDWRTHNGVDISAAEDEPVIAVADGTVEKVYEDAMMGTTVVIAHQGGMKTIYSNLSPETSVSEGQEVSAGYAIGSVGMSAPSESKQDAHLHFCVLKNDEYINPVSLFES